MTPEAFLDTPDWFLDILEERLDAKLEGSVKGKILNLQQLWVALGIQSALG